MSSSSLPPASSIAARLEDCVFAIRKRVAIVLPPSKGAMIANLAVMLAGKIPVNLNFTAGRVAIEAAIRRTLAAKRPFGLKLRCES